MRCTGSGPEGLRTKQRKRGGYQFLHVAIQKFEGSRPWTRAVFSPTIQYQYPSGHSPRRMPTINPHISSRHKRASRRHQENRRPSKILRPAQLPQHVLLRPFFSPFRVLLKQLLHHRRHNIPRRNRIDPNTILPPLRGQIPRQLQNTSFGGIIRGTYQSLHISSPTSAIPQPQKTGIRLNGEKEDLYTPY